MRLMGVLILSATAVFVGIHFALCLKMRVRQINLSIQCVEDIRGAIRYARRPKADLISEMAEKYPELEWLKEAGEGENFKLGKDFCQGLGAGDLETQMDHCDMYYQRFSACLKTAEKEKNEKERLYVSLGIFAGAAVFVLFI